MSANAVVCVVKRDRRGIRRSRIRRLSHGNSIRAVNLIDETFEPGMWNVSLPGSPSDDEGRIGVRRHAFRIDRVLLRTGGM